MMKLYLAIGNYKFSNNRGKTIEIPCKDKELRKIIEDFYAFNNHLEAFELQLKYCDPSANDNWAIKWAARNGHLPIVKILILDPRVDPSANDKPSHQSGLPNMDICQSLNSSSKT